MFDKSDGRMSDGVFVAILVAALMNAAWNSIIKVGGDKMIVMALTTVFGSAVSLLALPFVGVFASTDWLLLALSIGIHTVYHFVLPIAYRNGDLGHVYPIARGGAPLLVTLAAFVVAGELPACMAFVGVLCLSAGVLALAFQTHAKARTHRGTFYALLTSVLIASYTVVDALGARRSESALGFAVLLTIGDGIATALIVLWWRGWAAFRVDARTLSSSAMAGAMQIGAYWIAVWALARAPMGAVSALRESSVLFVALISTCLLKEHWSTYRVACSLVVFAGIVLLRLGQ